MVMRLKPAAEFEMTASKMATTCVVNATTDVLPTLLRLKKTRPPVSKGVTTSSIQTDLAALNNSKVTYAL